MMAITCYYVYNSHPNGCIKKFNTEEELIKNYKKYVYNEGYNALGVEFITEKSTPGAVDIVNKLCGVYDWRRSYSIYNSDLTINEIHFINKHVKKIRKLV